MDRISRVLAPPPGQNFVPYCRDALRTSTTAACFSSLTARPRAMSGLSRSWCSSASISPFAVSSDRGADLALAAPPRPARVIVVATRAGLHALAVLGSYVRGSATTERRTTAAVACGSAGRPPHAPTTSWAAEFRPSVYTKITQRGPPSANPDIRQGHTTDFDPGCVKTPSFV